MTRPRCVWFGTDSTSWFSKVNSFAVVGGAGGTNLHDDSFLGAETALPA